MQWMLGWIGAQHHDLLALHAVQDAQVFDHDFARARIGLAAQDTAKVECATELTREARKVLDILHGLLGKLDGQRHKTSLPITTRPLLWIKRAKPQKS